MDPVLDLPLNEGSGTTVYDRSGYNNHGTCYNTEWVKVWRDWLLSFNGVNAYTEIPDSPSLRSDTYFTVIAWAIVRQLPASGYDHVPIVWRGANIGWSSNYHFRIAIRDNGAVTWGSGGQDGIEYWFDGGSVSDKLNQWVNFAYVARGRTLEAYLNGAQVASRDANPPYRVAGYKTYLGYANRNGTPVYTNGIVGSVFFCRKALSVEQIKFMAQLFRGERRKPPSF